VLAYVFWHRPRADVDRVRYEDSLRRFHVSLDLPSASFRLDRLPFTRLGGYEDWYLVEDWQALGRLNMDAVDELHRGAHDVIARLASEGWGGVYALLRGRAEVPDAVSWLEKPPGRSYGEFLDRLASPTIWQRQMVLGPAPEFCVAERQPRGRERV
jgi:hypothetical protein